MSRGVADAEGVYSRYAGLMQSAPQGLGGCLLLASLAGEAADAEEAASAVRAANIAGAATLLLAPNAETARAQVRSGVCDILVTTLDEALRVLKNEIRRRRQVAVVLPQEAQSAVHACEVRGVQPDLLLGVGSPLLVARGARQVAVAGKQGASAELVWWSVMNNAATLERLAGESIREPSRATRLRWLMHAPRYLWRELSRVRTMPLTREETTRFCELVQGSQVAGGLTGAVSVLQGGVELLGCRVD